MNQFSNDGSFLEQFRKMQQAEQPQECPGAGQDKAQPRNAAGVTAAPSSSKEKKSFGFRGPMKGKVLMKVGTPKKPPTVQKTAVSEAFAFEDSDEEGQGKTAAAQTGPPPGSSNGNHHECCFVLPTLPSCWVKWEI